MDKARVLEMLHRGAEQVGVPLSREAAAKMLLFGEELARWNRKLNLTAITEPEEVVEKHFIDCLAVVPELLDAGSLLDIGSGGGFPGIPIKLAAPAIEVTLVDASSRKVAFLKHVLAKLGLVDGIRAVHTRAGGDPVGENLPRTQVVISRALRAPEEWLGLGPAYVATGGRLVAMFGSKVDLTDIQELANRRKAEVRLRAYRLPFSGARRTFAVFQFAK